MYIISKLTEKQITLLFYLIKNEHFKEIPFVYNCLYELVKECFNSFTKNELKTFPNITEVMSLKHKTLFNKNNTKFENNFIQSEKEFISNNKFPWETSEQTVLRLNEEFLVKSFNSLNNDDKQDLLNMLKNHVNN